MKHHLELPAAPGSGLQGFKNDLLSHIKIRFGVQEMESNKLLGPATLLDPRFKDQPFSSEGSVKAVKDLILNEIITHTDNPLPSASSPDESASKSSGKGQQFVYWGIS